MFRTGLPHSTGTNAQLRRPTYSTTYSILDRRRPPLSARGCGVPRKSERVPPPGVPASALLGESENGLAEAGLRVRMNGRGMSVTDGQREVKASEIDRAFSRNNIEKRFGAYSAYRARVAVAGDRPAPQREAAGDRCAHAEGDGPSRADRDRHARPVAAGPQQLLDKTGIRHVQQLAMMVKEPHLAVAKAAWDLTVKLARETGSKTAAGANVRLGVSTRNLLKNVHRPLTAKLLEDDMLLRYKYSPALGQKQPHRLSSPCDSTTFTVSWEGGTIKVASVATIDGCAVDGPKPSLVCIPLTF